MANFSYQAPPDIAGVAKTVTDTSLENLQMGIGKPEADVAQTKANTNLVNAQATGANLDNQMKQINLTSLDAYRKAMTNVFSPQGSQGQPGGNAPSQPSQPGPVGNTAAPQGGAPVSAPEAQTFPVGPSGSNTPGSSPAPSLVETKPGEPIPGQGASQQPDSAPSQGTPASADSSQPATTKAPTAPGGTVPAGPAQSAQHASDIVEHANEYPNGTPNFLSTDNIQKVAQQWLAGGGNPNDVMKYVIDSTKTQSELKKQAADTYAATQKGGLDAIEGQSKFLDYQKNQAFSALQKLQAGDLAGAEATANQVLHQTLTTPEGRAAVMGLANTAPDFLKFQEQGNKNLDTQSQIVYRANQNAIEQQNANTKAGELEVARGNLTREQLSQAGDFQGKATSADRTIRYAGQLQDDLNVLQGLVDKGAITRGLNNSYVIVKDKLDPGVLSAIAKYPGMMAASNGDLVADNLIHRIGSGVTEMKASAMAAGGQRGASGSDKRMDLLEQSAAGTGLDLSQPNNVIRDSINYVRNVTKGEAASASTVRDSYNSALQQQGGGIFKPIQNDVPRVTSPTPGEVVHWKDGSSHVYVGPQTYTAEETTKAAGDRNNWR